MEWTRGDDETFPMTVTNDDGTAYDLTGCTAALRIAQQAGMSALLALNFTVTDAANGLMEAAATDAQTLALSAQNHVYQVILTTASGDTKTVVQGTLRVRNSVLV